MTPTVDHCPVCLGRAVVPRVVPFGKCEMNILAICNVCRPLKHSELYEPCVLVDVDVPITGRVVQPEEFRFPS